MKWLFDPRLFNFVILALFALAAIRWAMDKNWGQAAYFFFAFCLNWVVTFSMLK
jgi:hypothetical protein